MKELVVMIIGNSRARKHGFKLGQICKTSGYGINDGDYLVFGRSGFGQFVHQSDLFIIGEL